MENEFINTDLKAVQALIMGIASLILAVIYRKGLGV
jgi:hypothetical protein